MKPNTKLLLERELSRLARLKEALSNYVTPSAERRALRRLIEDAEAEVERLKEAV